MDEFNLKPVPYFDRGRSKPRRPRINKTSRVGNFGHKSEAKCWVTIELTKPLPDGVGLNGVYLKERESGGANVILIFDDGSTLVM